MSDFPKRNASFNPNAYRSQAAYDAHLKASRVSVSNAAPKPDHSFNTNGYRSQVRANNDFPKADKTFDRNGYRRQARVDNDFQKTDTSMTFNPNGYRSQVAHSASKNPYRGKNNAPKLKQIHKPQKRHAAQKAMTSSNNKTENNDEPHFMSDAEVRQWFREAEADYERDKKAGRFDKYVPAGGHAPDFSAFRKTFDASKTMVGGLKNSRHAPKAADSEAAKN